MDVMTQTLPFTAPWLLAPMEGITDPAFRDLVLARNPAQALGGAFTEFVRVIARPVPAWILEKHLGPGRFPQPIGVQLMGNDLEALAQTARHARDAGARLVDLNFGCPAKGALRGCAGSALLDQPEKLEAVVAAVRQAVPELPVTAKIRAGGVDASRVEELARAAEQGGANMLTVHCRTRVEMYQEQVDWQRIARAVAAVRIPVCGNGSVARHEDLERMRRETGARFAMVGRGALANPWIFSGHRASQAEAATFLLEYFETLCVRGASARAASGRVKQLLQHWDAGGLLGETREGTQAQRERWLREPDPAVLIAWLREGEEAMA